MRKLFLARQLIHPAPRKRGGGTGVGERLGVLILGHLTLLELINISCIIPSDRTLPTPQNSGIIRHGCTFKTDVNPAS
ncbi:hypothetical protein [Nostoc sp. GT001]|uniref:hypothetical protein n=1 Tax=Nostoc sp. GT001 TaxID=3056647 RepID=UPI0025AB4827|nr:hypothetical protein [Nostoc sp. GT001]MDM9582073.1 hypothetical protein [Nostoc sp. GT001]